MSGRVVLLPAALRAALLAALPLALGACCTSGGPKGSFSAGQYRDSHVSYRIAEPGPGWTPVTQPKANAAWVHAGADAALLVNSSCEGVADAPLEALTNDLLMGSTERDIVEQNRIMLSRREALETTARVKLDGVPRSMKLLVLKKDGCVYDVVASAPEAGFAIAQDAFARLRDSLDVGPRRDR